VASAAGPEDPAWFLELASSGGVITGEAMKRMLTQMHLPPESFEFPKSGKRNLRFRREWARQFPWILYSKSADGVLCKFCSAMIHSSEVGKGHHQRTGLLVQAPYNNWKKAIEDFRAHQKTLYHNEMTEKAADFLKNFKQGTDVVKAMHKGRSEQAAANRSKLAGIVKCVLFCGRQGIALRGHKDSGALLTTEEQKSNEGNVRALIRFRIEAGDLNLEQHLRSAAANASYTSPRIQNEILEACNKIIVAKLVKRVNDADFFTVMADETTDIRGLEQMSVAVRFVEEESPGGNFTVREEFLNFVPVTDMRGQALAETITGYLKKVGINLEKMRGQGYDGASAMSGKFRGCAAVIQQSYPKALYLHCASHSLNLAVGHACSVQLIRNCLGTIKETTTLFRASAKRTAHFTEVISEMIPGSRKTRLTRLCETRWVERLDCVIQFKDMYEVIVESLRRLQASHDSEESGRAFALCSALEKPGFLIALCCMSTLFGMCHGLSELLQTPHMDLARCVKHADLLATEVRTLRQNAESAFHPIFTGAAAMASEIGVEITVPRTTSRQVHRDCYATASPEEYYRIAVFVPFFDDFIGQLEARFLQHRDVLKGFCAVTPSDSSAPDDESVAMLLERCGDELPCTTDVLKGELRMWRRRWSEVPADRRPTSFVALLNECPVSLWPSIHRIVKLAATLPVTVATNERSFSTLRRLKTYLRSTTGETRLNGLAHLNVHREVEVTLDEIFDELAKQERRLDLVL
jgi:hypothetical protein